MYRREQQQTTRYEMM